MNLGERIYQLRTEKNLSQGDLADKLDVSRQSVSKWENNTAVPDLDKLIKICDVFEISLDELTGREKPKEKQTNKLENFKNSLTKTQFRGCILIGVALLSLIIPFGAFFTLPIVICAIICLSIKKHAWYWCIWAVYFPIQMSLDIIVLRGSYLPHIIEAVFIVVIAVVTYKVFKNADIIISKIKSIIILIAGIVYDVLYVMWIWFYFYSNLLEKEYTIWETGEIITTKTEISLLGYIFLHLILVAGIGATLIGISLSIKNLRRQKDFCHSERSEESQPN